MSPRDFDNILRLLYFRWGFVENRRAWWISLTNTMIFFSCTSQIEIAFSRCFHHRILRRVTRTSGPCCSADKSVLFCLRHVKWYYHANQNNLLDAMVQVPYGNCFSWLKKNSQTLREERTLQQPMVNNETIMLSAWATLLRDICFGIRFLVKDVMSFSFTLDWFLFLHFFSSTGKKKT